MTAVTMSFGETVRGVRPAWFRSAAGAVVVAAHAAVIALFVAQPRPVVVLPPVVVELIDPGQVESQPNASEQAQAVNSQAAAPPEQPVPVDIVTPELPEVEPFVPPPPPEPVVAPPDLPEPPLVVAPEAPALPMPAKKPEPSPDELRKKREREERIRQAREERRQEEKRKQVQAARAREAQRREEKQREAARETAQQSAAAPSAQARQARITGASSRGSGAVQAGAGASANYRALVNAELQRRKSYPRAAEMAGQKGTVVVSLTIGSSGRVTSHSIMRSSGYPLLDGSIAGMMSGVSLPPPPGGVFRSQVSIRFQ